MTPQEAEPEKSDESIQRRDVYIGELWERLSHASTQYEKSLYLITSGALVLLLYVTDRTFDDLTQLKGGAFGFALGALVLSLLFGLVARVSCIMSFHNRLERLGKSNKMLPEKKLHNWWENTTFGLQWLAIGSLVFGIIMAVAFFKIQLGG